MIEELLKKNNLKVTKSRVMLIDTIKNLKDSATMKNILDNLNEYMDISTIYRMLTKLLEKKIIDKNVNFNNEIYYQLHHIHEHYIHCINCNKKELILDCPFDKDTLSGYKVTNHILNIEGICKDCQK